jgi:hypothetical protein
MCLYHVSYHIKIASVNGLSRTCKRALQDESQMLRRAIKLSLNQMRFEGMQGAERHLWQPTNRRVSYPQCLFTLESQT